LTAARITTQAEAVQVAAQQAADAADAATAEAAAAQAAATAAQLIDADVGYGETPNDMDEVWKLAAAEHNPAKSLERITGYQQAVLDRIGLLGTLLTGLGAVTAAVVVTRDTYTTTILGWEHVPVIPLGALVSAVLGALAVMVALVARRPRFAKLNPQNITSVDEWFGKEIKRNKWPTRIASWLFIGAAAVAALTSAVAGLLVIGQPDQTVVNQATLSATTGEDSISGHLGGSVNRLDEDEAALVVVGYCPPAAAGATACADKKGIARIATENRLGTYTAYPDQDGTVNFDIDITGIPPGTVVAAIIEVRAVLEGSLALTVDDRLVVLGAPPATPKPATPSKSPTTSSPSPSPSLSPSSLASPSASARPSA
jgi:hypothetical protein